jgi:hypothetical protein
MTPKQMLPMELAIRETAWSYYRVLGYLPNPSETLVKMGKDISEYKYLLEDARVNGVFSARKSGTTSQQVVIDQADSAVRPYKVIRNLFKSWPMQDIIAEMLNAVWFGYQPVEVVWERVGGLVLPAKVEPKDPDWFRFSDTNELRYLTKRNMVTGEPVPKYKFLLPRYRGSYERPYGRPLAASCYWPCKFRHSGFRFFTLFVEKFGQPWIKASYPLGTTQSQRIQEMISTLNMGTQDNIIAWPTEYNVEAIDINKTASADVFKSFIELANEEITISVLGQNLTTSIKDKGSFAASKTHQEVKQALVDEDCHMIERALNTLISWVFELNWGADAPKPELKLVGDQTPTADDGQLAVSLYQAGARFTKKYFENHFHLLEDEFDLMQPQILGSDGQPVAGAMLSDKPAPGPGGDSTPGLTAATHESTDPAEDNKTIDSTKAAFHNLDRR